MYTFMEPGYYDGARREDDLDEYGISLSEREGMETIKQEVLKQWAFMDDSSSAPRAWEDAALMKLQALASQIAN
jgi:salicylate hydroxylase